MSKLRSSRLVLTFAFALGLGLGACTIANPNHCFNIAYDANGWCAFAHPELPYCSPCEADNNGCVADEPTDCPQYTAPATETGATETGATETGATETGATETGATETGTTATG